MSDQCIVKIGSQQIIAASEDIIKLRLILDEIGIAYIIDRFGDSRWFEHRELIIPDFHLISFTLFSELDTEESEFLERLIEAQSFDQPLLNGNP
jgi:hypothetical protein